MDFDECAVEQHLSRMLTESFEHRSAIVEKDKSNTPILRIANLFHCYIGLSKNDLEKRIEEILKDITWKKTFLNFMNVITSRKDILPIFISSGLTISASSALTSVGFDNINIIADDILYDKSNCVLGPYTIVDAEKKGEIVSKLMNKATFSKCVTVGHGAGDANLIQEGSPGFRFSFNDSELAKSVADHVIEVWDEILPYLDV